MKNKFVHPATEKTVSTTVDSNTSTSIPERIPTPPMNKKVEDCDTKEETDYTLLVELLMFDIKREEIVNVNSSDGGKTIELKKGKAEMQYREIE